MKDEPAQPPDPLARPLRVLNLIDGLSGGGSERVLWDTVRLSDPARIRHFVSTASPEWLGDFRYAAALRDAGAYVNRPKLKGFPPLFFRRWLVGLSEFLRSSPREPSAHWRSPIRFITQISALFLSFPRALRSALVVRPDVVHAHTFYSFVHATALGAILRVPVVHTVPCLFSQMSDAGLAWLPRYYRWSRRRVSFYFSGYPRDLAQAGIEAARVLPLYSVLEISALQAVRAQRTAYRLDIMRRLHLPADAMLALAVGRLHPSKGHAETIAAFGLLARKRPQLHLIILGEGVERDNLESQIRALGINDRVHLPGFVADSLPFYAAADLYIRAYSFEGDNLSSLQALAMGVPAVGFDTRQELDVLRDAGAGLLVPPGDRAALADAMNEILALPDRGARMGASGRAHLDAKFDVHYVIALFESTYFQLVANRAGMPAPRRLKNSLHWLTKLAVTAAILAFVLTHVANWASLCRAVVSFPLSALAAMLGLHFLQRIVVAWQTRLALAHAGIPLSTRRVFHVHLITSFFSIILPGEVAGAAVSWHMFSKDSGRRAQTAAALVYLRLIGLFVIVIVGAVGLLIEPRLFALHAQWAVVAAGIVVGLPLLSFIFRPVARGLRSASDFVIAWVPWQGLHSASGSFWSSVQEFTAMRRSPQAAVWFASVLAYMLSMAGGLIAMQATHMAAPAVAIIWLTAVVTLASLVPFTIAGFGVRELGAAVLLKEWYGVPTETAVLFSLALGMVAIIASAGFGGVALLVEVIAVRRSRSHGA